MEIVKPMDIEKRSFEIIGELLGERKLDPENELVIKRCIHTAADFDYADNLCFSEHATTIGVEALRNGACIVTDTKMAFSGIHFNYSFADELLEREFELSGEMDFSKFKNDFYVALAERAAVYGWIVTAITAASPVMDSSFFEEKVFDKTVFFGMASVRASEFGYWNYFAPILNYTDVRSYADSIQQYVDMGVLRVPGELYYPIRLKPRGLNNLPRLREEGVDHIELRMIDLNPLVPAGIDERDVFFCQLLLVWLAATERQPWGRADQVQAIQNFKNAAHYDLNTVHMVIPDGRVYSVQEAALHIIAFLEEFYKDFPQDVQDCLAFQKKKFTNPETRYAWQIRERFGEDFVKKGMELAKERQELYL